MLEKLRVIFTIPELRQKILLTLALLGVYRIGYQIRLPMVNVGSGAGNQLDSFLERFSVFAATDLREVTIFGLGIMPYISASIVFQLLGSVWKPIEQLRKEGQTGMRKITEYTRYLTVVLCIIQSYVYLHYVVMSNPDMVASQFCYPGTSTLHFGWQLTAIAIMTCGTVFLMWLGEQIDEYGIGNGISLLIMASILAQMPKAMLELQNNMTTQLSGSSGEIGPDKLIVLAALFVAVVFGVVFITLGQRRIQTQSAKHVRGRRVYGGTKQFLPLRINQAGVMPIIFASSLLMLPGLLFGVMQTWFSNPTLAQFFASLASAFQSGQSLSYIILYVAMIFFFCYFWTSITFNPKEMSENLKDHGTFIPGYRPGKRTADYLEKVMIRITYVGAAFLAVVAIVPIIVNIQLGVPFSVASFYGGTGLLIAVSVAFDLIQKIDNHLLMRNYKGLLES
ncbi:preprotein translocase subunit SecY [Aureliella helgolandensis]|uniref:Protein translocase subunit SecY n=1 Tax=Aureliella helgolandensis TaxID=2527968 RepID=A0A518G1X5_9BACT|nr:preprotein translocase subunit SecY [Aureliella helgolandensis]QDV22627.1 Protein translocase subunit SecY [Aureliella helgolandensis]